MTLRIPKPASGGGGGTITSVNGDTGPAVVISVNGETDTTVEIGDGNLGPIGGWTRPGAADFSIVGEAPPGSGVLAGANDGTGLPGVVLAALDDAARSVVAVMPLSAAIPDGGSLDVEWEPMAVATSTTAPILCAVKEVTPGVYEGAAVWFDGGIGGSLFAGRIAVTAAAPGSPVLTAVYTGAQYALVPRYIRFAHTGSSIEILCGMDGITYQPLTDSGLLFGDTDLILLEVIQNTLSPTQIRIPAYRLVSP